MNLTCNSCFETKPYTDFSKCRKRKTGYQGKCKACNKKDNDKYRNENKEYWSYEYGYFSDKKKFTPEEFEETAKIIAQNID